MSTDRPSGRGDHRPDHTPRPEHKPFPGQPDHRPPVPPPTGTKTPDEMRADRARYKTTSEYLAAKAAEKAAQQAGAEDTAPARDGTGASAERGTRPRDQTQLGSGQARDNAPTRETADPGTTEKTNAARDVSRGPNDEALAAESLARRPATPRGAGDDSLRGHSADGSTVVLAAADQFVPGTPHVIVDLIAGGVTIAAAAVPTSREGWRKGKMAIDRIPSSFEKPFRDAIGHAIRNEIDQMKSTLLLLNDKQAAFSIGMCALVTGYVAIDVCGRQWPDEDNRRGIAQDVTESSSARAFGLMAEDSYAYLTRVALGFERLDEVFPEPEDAGTIPFIVTGQLLLSFHPADVKWWDYLNRIEDVIEFTEQADLDLLPALMLRSRRLGSPRVFGEIRRN